MLLIKYVLWSSFLGNLMELTSEILFKIVEKFTSVILMMMIATLLDVHYMPGIKYFTVSYSFQ